MRLIEVFQHLRIWREQQGHVLLFSRALAEDPSSLYLLSELCILIPELVNGALQYHSDACAVFAIITHLLEIILLTQYLLQSDEVCGLCTRQLKIQDEF